MDGRKHVVNITSLQRNSHHPKMMISGRVSAKNDSEQEGRFFRALPVIFLIFYKEITGKARILFIGVRINRKITPRWILLN
jgi:hypothetical protein